jgi:hypothetical protein
MRGAVPGGFAPVAVEGGEPIIVSVTNKRKDRIRFVSEAANGGPGVTTPEATPPKEAAEEPSPEGQSQTPRPTTYDEDVQELLQEERAADFRAMMDVEKAMEAVA